MGCANGRVCCMHRHFDFGFELKENDSSWPAWWMRWRLTLVCSMESVKLEKYADDLMCHKFFDCVHLFLTIRSKRVGSRCHWMSRMAVLHTADKTCCWPMTNPTEMCASHASPSFSCFVGQMSTRLCSLQANGFSRKISILPMLS